MGTQSLAVPAPALPVKSGLHLVDSPVGQVKVRPLPKDTREGGKRIKPPNIPKCLKIGQGLGV